VIVYVQGEFISPAGDRLIAPNRIECWCRWEPGLIMVERFSTSHGWLIPPAHNIHMWGVAVSIWDHPVGGRQLLRGRVILDEPLRRGVLACPPISVTHRIDQAVPT
jgi:hypothetical protein